MFIIILLNIFFSYISLLPLYYILHSNLIGVINDEFVGSSTIFALLNYFTERYCYVLRNDNIALWVRVLRSDGVGAVHTFGQKIGVSFTLFKFLLVSKSYFANNEGANTTG